MSEPERAGREGDQALPVEGSGDIIGALIAQLEQRRAIGLRRYGRPLQAFNGRDVHRDHLDELLDAAAYAEQVRLEYRALWEAVRALGRKARGEQVSPDGFAAAMLLAIRIDEQEVRCAG